MRSLRSSLVLVFAWAWLPAFGAGQEPGPATRIPPLPPLPGDVLDLLVVTPHQPVFLRVHLQIDGVSFERAWEAYAASLFHRLDADHDRRLAQSEMSLATWPVETSARGYYQLYQHLQTGPLDQRQFRDVIDHMVQRVSLETLETGEDYADAPLRHALDANGDGLLSRFELDRGWDALRKADIDENEVIDEEDLEQWYWQADGDVLGLAMEAETESADNSPAIVRLGDAGEAKGFAFGLLRRYDGVLVTGGEAEDIAPPAEFRVARRPKNGRLEAAELGFPPESIARFDKNGDGGLSIPELMEFVSAPPFHVVIVARLKDEGAWGPRVTLAAGKQQAGHWHGSVRECGGARLRLERETFQLDIEPELSAWQQIRGQARQEEFTDGDFDSDGKLSREEFEENYYEGADFQHLDTNGDKCIDRLEYTLWSLARESAGRCRAALTLQRHQASLMELLDANGDEGLGVREFRRAADRLLALDRNGDNRFHPDDLKQHYTLRIGRGDDAYYEDYEYYRADEDEFEDGEEDISQEKPPTPPDWFLNMDANGDGDLTLREFIGGEDAFRRFDQDGDGLLDAREARNSKLPP